MSFSGWKLGHGILVVVLFPTMSRADRVDFERDIAPILEDRCTYCHGEDEQESGLRLDRRPKMLRGGDSGLPAVVPGKPEQSYLLEVVKHLDPDVKMPPDEEMIPAEEIDLLTRWIQEGAVWPGQMDAVVEETSDHWSFRPVVRSDVPEVETSSDNPIDAFLLQSLAEHELSFSEPADPRSLIRRASIVLTGLAPTPEETTQFIAEHSRDSETAYESLVGRLLDSPHFGERWAQHWLDVIRWAETNGSEANLYRKNAWIYRDYVVPRRSTKTNRTTSSFRSKSRATRAEREKRLVSSSLGLMSRLQRWAANRRPSVRRGPIAWTRSCRPSARRLWVSPWGAPAATTTSSTRSPPGTITR